MVEAVLILNGQRVNVKGLIDSGNSLTDPYMGKGVHIICFSVISKLLDGINIYEHGFKLIPFRSLGKSNGLIRALTFDELIVYRADENELDSLNGNVYQSIFLGGEATPTRFVYNHFIAPFVNYPICGMIWYQGESDCHPDNASTYAVRFKGLIENYRRKWSIDFPVYMVELPSCYDKPDALSEEDVWAFIDFSAVRMEMGRIPNMLDKVYITASSDLWLDRSYWNSLHPYCKWGQAKRLSETILALHYGIGDSEYALAPQMTEVFYNGNDATVRFKYKAGGLTSVDSSDIKGFEILINGEWIASKRINVLDDDDVIINADSEIMGVRYNAHIENSFTDEVNLSNGEGIPAIAFVDMK